MMILEQSSWVTEHMQGKNKKSRMLEWIEQDVYTRGETLAKRGHKTPVIWKLLGFYKAE